MRSDLLLVQYNPFGFGRWGFAPRLPAALARTKTRRPATALIVHEAFVPITDTRSLLMGTWQRAQFRAVSAGVDLVFHVVEDRLRRLAGRWPRRPAEYLAVGANVPHARAERIVVRAHGWSDDTIVIATLGGAHPSKLQGWIAPAIEAVAPPSGDRCAMPTSALSRSRFGCPGWALAPGYLEADALARLLAAADLFLARTTTASRDGAGR